MKNYCRVWLFVFAIQRFALAQTGDEYFTWGVSDGYTGWIADWDEDILFVCPGADEIITGIYSEHSNGKEDRLFKYDCTPINSPSGTVEGQNCAYSTDWINDWDADFNTNCGTNKFIRGFNSIHSNGKEDRAWKLYCCDMIWSNTDSALTYSVISSSGYVNDFDATFDFHVPIDTWIVGMLGTHDNGKEDRRYGWNYAAITTSGTCSSFSYSLASDVSSCTNVLIDGSCAFTCASGYTTSTGETGSATCDPDFSWSHDTCFRKPCNSPEIANSDSEGCANTAYGSSCTITCDAGHELTGASVITCNENQGWSSVPSCGEATCESLTIANLESSRASCLSAGEAGVTCAVECQEGYSLREGDLNAITCRFGIWNDDPECVETDCDIPEIDNSNSGTACAETRGVDDECTIACNDGYVFADDTKTSITCELGPSWTSGPQCIEKPCEELIIPGSHTECSTIVDDNCEVECDDGYRIAGGASSFVECLFGGIWSNPQIACEEIPCDVPDVPNSNAAGCGELPIGTDCQLICNDGYEFETSLTTIQCEPGPQLTTAPVCQLIPCNTLFISNSANSHLCDTEVDKVCNIECNEGYELVGQDSVWCQFGGGDNWSQLPSCELISCDNPAIDNSNADQCEGTLAENECSHEWTCDERYEKILVDDVEHDGYCNANGEWEDLASCVEITCPILSVANSNAGESCVGTLAVADCSYECDDDYEVQNGENAVASCSITGEWESVAVCEQIVRCDPPTVPNSQAGAECASVRAGSLCQFTCEENFAVQDDPVVEDGDTTIECDENGAWVYLQNCTEAIIFGRIPEETIEDTDMDAFFQLSSFIQNTVNEQLFTLMGLEGAKSEDIILNQAGRLDIYNWAKGSDEHTNYFNRQPHAGDKLVDNFYSQLLKSGMKLKTLSDEDQSEVDEIDAELDGMFLAELDRLTPTCENGLMRFRYGATAGDLNYNCYFDIGFENNVNYVADEQRLQARRDELLYDPVAEMRARFDANIGADGRGDWSTNPSAEVLDTFFSDEAGQVESVFEYEITTSKVSEQSIVEEVSRPGFAAYKDGQFLTVKYNEQETNIKVKMSFRKWASVIVTPGTWYDDSWQVVVQEEEHLADGFTADIESDDENTISDGESEEEEEEEESDDDEPEVPLQYVWGPNGYMNSMLRRIIIAREMNITASGNSTFFQELATIYQDADSVRFGNICTGKACSEGVNVIIDTSAPNLNTLSKEMSDYLLPIVTTVKDNVFRDGVENKIAVLGSVMSINAADYAGVLFSLSGDIGIPESSFDWYEGADEISSFCEDLGAGTTNPSIIWFTGDEFNGVDVDESVALRDCAHIFNNFTTAGGGLIALGEATRTLSWVQELLPGMTIESQCDNSAAEITHAGRMLLSPTFTNDIVRRIPCTGNFQNQFGNFDQLVSDIDGKFVMLGAYGGITEGTSPLEDEDSDTVVSSEISTNTGVLQYTLSINRNDNVILAEYAPRFPNTED